LKALAARYKTFPRNFFFTNNKWGIEATIGNKGYNFTRIKYKLNFESTPETTMKMSKKTSAFGLNFNLSSFTMGFKYYLGRFHK
jgi:hypothetical protein